MAKKKSRTVHSGKMGMKSCGKKDPADCTTWSWREWVAVAVIIVVFYGGIIYSDSWSRDRQVRMQLEGRNALTIQQEANRKYIEGMFK